MWFFFLGFKNRVDYVGIEVTMRRGFPHLAKKPSTNPPPFFFKLCWISLSGIKESRNAVLPTTTQPPLYFETTLLSIHLLPSTPPSLPSVRGKRKHDPKSLHHPRQRQSHSRDGWLAITDMSLSCLANPTCRRFLSTQELCLNGGLVVCASSQGGCFVL